MFLIYALAARYPLSSVMVALDSLESKLPNAVV